MWTPAEMPPISKPSADRKHVCQGSALLAYFQDIICDELNSKKLPLPMMYAFTSYSLLSAFEDRWTKYGKLLGGIKKALAELDGNAAMDELKADGQLTLTLTRRERSYYWKVIF